MAVALEQFTKSKEYLICVDSDGCAMDTMDIKHFNCFGPCMIQEWKLTKWEDEIQTRWNDINLYSMTRGVNRFHGLVLILKEVNDKYVEIPGLLQLEDWVSHSDELSNPALEKAIAKGGNPILSKALAWSKAVNESIKKLPKEALVPYEGVREALEYASQFADIAIVSSANLQAVEEEWTRHELLPHVDVLCAQNSGSKAFCISKLLEQGYAKSHVLMVGDAPGDLAAASKNGVVFYPILVRKEKESWSDFKAYIVEEFIAGNYQESLQDEKIEEFHANLQ